MRKEVLYFINHIQTQIDNLLVQLTGREKKMAIDAIMKHLKEIE